MDAIFFDRLTRLLIEAPSRRSVLRGLAGAALGLTPAGHSNVTGAKNKKRKKLQFNDFGCVNVGGKCWGKDSVCCSGICQGKKPKKGKKDKRTCVAHDAASCQVGQQSTYCGGNQVACVTSAGAGGLCQTTTGNAAYCSATRICFQCRRDADCLPLCGPQAACVTCTGCSKYGVGTACVGTGSTSCSFPP